MIFDLPKKFDANEWWILLGMAALLTVFLWLPRRFPPVLTLVFLLFTANLSITVDFLLASEYPYNFYDAMDTPTYDLFDFLMDTVNYSLYGYIFLYIYDRFRHKSILFRFCLVTGYIGVSLLMEWISLCLHVFKYKNWNMLYSSIAYVVIFSLYLLFFYAAKWAMRQLTAKQK